MKNNRTSTSFDDAITKTSVPVITIETEGKSYNFLIDTGSDNSFIDSSIESEVNNKDLIGYQGGITGATGSQSQRTSVYKITFTCGGKELTDNFTVNNFSTIFNYIRERSGIQVHGILGSRFLTKYGALLDFESRMFFI